MKIVVAHNFYQQPGGEDQVYGAEAALLESHGHDVIRFEMHNDVIDGMSRAALIGATIWNGRSQRALAALVQQHQPDVVHFHNTFPLISPSGYAAARQGGAAVVQTLHNFRVLCPNALFFRDGKPCEQCLGRAILWPGIKHGCYRDSRTATAVVATALTIHRAAGTWRRAVDAFVAPTRMARDKFIAGGLPAGRIHVKPNFVHPDPGLGAGDGGYAIFVGRLSAEKGLGTLLAAWQSLGNAALPLKIIGDGPLAPDVRAAAAARCPQIEWLGRRPLSEVYRHIGQAAVLIVPSECYETFGRTAVEAFATGTPVIAANHGAMAELVRDGETGLLFRPGDPAELARQVNSFIANRAAWTARRPGCRAEFEAHYTGARNYEMLMAIYEQAMEVECKPA
jgi:glycosyltransferase involved in cell wall biosynthesis